MQEIINSLTSTLLNIKEHQPFASLRIWFENGEIKFFLTNLPPRKGRQSSTPTPSERTVGAPESTPVDTPVENFPTDQAAPSIAPRPRTRGRPPRKRPCTTSTPSSSPEQLRTRTDQTNADCANVSIMSHNRNLSYVDIPCSNSFQVLADLDLSTDDKDENGFCKDCDDIIERTILCCKCYGLGKKYCSHCHNCEILW